MRRQNTSREGGARGRGIEHEQKSGWEKYGTGQGRDRDGCKSVEANIDATKEETG